jgi:hypothetical protein
MASANPSGAFHAAHGYIKNHVVSLSDHLLRLKVEGIRPEHDDTYEGLVSLVVQETPGLDGSTIRSIADEMIVREALRVVSGRR